MHVQGWYIRKSIEEMWKGMPAKAERSYLSYLATNSYAMVRIN